MFNTDNSRPPSMAIVLLNRLIRVLLSQISRNPINVDRGDTHCEETEVHQRKNVKGKETWKDPCILITGITVATQQEDRRTWIHGVIVKHNNDDHRGYCYTVRVMKTGRLITGRTKDICSTSKTAEEYVHKQIRKTFGSIEDIFTLVISRKIHHCHKQCSVNTKRETFKGQNSPSRSGKWKVEKNIVQYVAEKKKNCKGNQMQQAAHKPCAAIMDSKNDEVIRKRSGISSMRCMNRVKALTLPHLPMHILRRKMLVNTKHRTEQKSI